MKDFYDFIRKYNQEVYRVTNNSNFLDFGNASLLQNAADSIPSLEEIENAKESFDCL